MKLQITKTLTLALVLLFCWNDGFSKIKTEVDLEVKHYFVDLRVNNTISVLWFQIKKNASSAGDIKVLMTDISISTFDAAIRNLCETKEYINASRMVVGCLSLATSVACVIGAGATGAFPPLVQLLL